jgi:hypothetical protein
VLCEVSEFCRDVEELRNGTAATDLLSLTPVLLRAGLHGHYSVYISDPLRKYGPVHMEYLCRFTPCDQAARSILVDAICVRRIVNRGKLMLSCICSSLLWSGELYAAWSILQRLDFWLWYRCAGFQLAERLLDFRVANGRRVQIGSVDEGNGLGSWMRRWWRLRCCRWWLLRRCRWWRLRRRHVRRLLRGLRDWDVCIRRRSRRGILQCLLKELETGAVCCHRFGGTLRPCSTMRGRI